MIQLCGVVVITEIFSTFFFATESRNNRALSETTFRFPGSRKNFKCFEEFDFGTLQRLRFWISLESKAWTLFPTILNLF
jgi:hypothetical protein